MESDIHLIVRSGDDMRENKTEKNVYEAITNLEKSGFDIRFGRADHDPDVTVKLPNTIYAVEVKAGDPTLPLPSGIAIEMGHHMATARQEGWPGKVRGLVITNYKTPLFLKDELHHKDVLVIYISKNDDAQSIGEKIRETMRDEDNRTVLPT